MKRLILSLLPHEVFMILFALLFCAIAVCGMSIFSGWEHVLLLMSIVIVVILVMAWASSETNRARSPLRFYMLPLIPVFFKAVEYFAIPIYSSHNDDILIAADRVICFGVNPTVWLSQHIPNWPPLTEYLMLSYWLFFFLPTAVAIELFIKARKSNDYTNVNEVFFIVIFGFLLSYLSYLILPSIGPRFTLYNFLLLPSEQPGLWLTEPLRNMLNRGENIMAGMSMPEILRVVSRDAFPSGHTDITLLSIILAFRFKAKVRWAVLVLGLSLIFSTVYLRYHYVIDLIGGGVLAAITLYTWEWLRDATVAIRNRIGGAQGAA